MNAASAGELGRGSAIGYADPMNAPTKPLRFQGHSAAYAALTAGPLASFSAVLLFLGFLVESWGWITFASLALAICLALALYRFRVVIDPVAKTMKKAWCLGPLPLIRREEGLEDYDFVTLDPYTRQGVLRSRSIWQLLTPNYRVSLFGEAGTVPLGAFYRRAPAQDLAERTAETLGYDLYDRIIGA